MAETPLTDSIEALTTYANQVTGASDTNLSDAVYTLAQGYGGEDFVIQSIASSLVGLFQVTVQQPYVVPTSDVPSRIKIKAPYCTSIEEMFYQYSSVAQAYNIEEIELEIPADKPIVSIDAFRRARYIKKIVFTNGGVILNNPSYLLQSSAVETIIGELDLSQSTSVNVFADADNLKDVTIKASTIIVNVTCPSTVLTDVSVVSMANGLSETVTGKTITLNATVRARCSTLMGTNDNGTFVASASGTLSLADFITTVKGWTLA